MIRTLATSFATLAFLLAPMAAHATTPPGAVCTATTTVRASDGAIVTHRVCVVVLRSGGGK